MATDPTIIQNDTMSAAPVAPVQPQITVGGIDTATVKNNLAQFAAKNGGSLSTGQPAPAGVQQPAPTTMGSLDMTGFAGIIDTMRSKLSENNALADTRTKLLNVLYNRPLTADEMTSLDPSTQHLVQSGDKNQIEMQIRMINDKISGRTQSLDKSVSYITDAYQKTIDNAETQKHDAMTFLTSALTQAANAGMSPKDYLTSLYGKDGFAKLEKAAGIQIGDTGVTGLSLSQSIASQESGNDYKAVNADSGALGKYQIVPKDWFSMIGLDPNSDADKQKFLADPTLQDTLHQAIINKLSETYNGDVDKVIAAYYGGDKAAQVVGTPAGDVKQGNYPSINDYVNQVKNRMGGGPNSSDTTIPTIIETVESQTDRYQPIKDLGGLSVSELETYAKSFISKDGVFPNFGLSAKGNILKMKDAVAKYASYIVDQTGLDMPTLAALYKANSAALNKFIYQQSAVTAYENTAKKNLDMFLAASKGMVDSGSPWVNTPLRSIDTKGLGSDQLAIVNTARQVAVNEISRVVAGNPNMTGVLSDSARKEVESFIPENATISQIFHIAETLNQDMENRKASGQDMIQKLVSDTGTSVGSTPQANATPVDFKGKIVSASDNDTYLALKKANPAATDESLYNALKAAGKVQ